MSSAAPAGRPEASRRPAGSNLLPTLRVAVSGGLFAIGTLLVVAELIALAMSLVVQAYGLWAWTKVGLLTALLSVRADVEATIRGSSSFLIRTGVATANWRLVPMLLTIGFLVLAARGGRRAARERRGGSAAAAVPVAAVGVAAPVAAIAAAAATLVTLSFPSFGVTIAADPGSAALWGGLTAAAGAAAGAFLEARLGAAAAVLRGGLAAYGWALFLLAAGVAVVATLEPDVTRSYLDALRDLGGGGVVLFGVHALAVPSQSALLMAPASGACLDLVGQNSGLRLCPWTLTPSGPAVGAFLAGPFSLAPWFWSFNAVPAVCAALAGHRAASGTERAPGIGLGALAGIVFAALTLAGAWYASPQVPFLVVPRVTIGPDLPVMAATMTAWGVVGGALGGWLVRRS
jgi:hypothetical protein